jgi:putative FmdB family regulatory protein
MWVNLLAVATCECQQEVRVPRYQYACTEPACGHEFEAVQSFSDPALSACPICEGRLRKVFSAVGVVFKGSGFYRNDSRADNSKRSSGSKENAAAASSGDSSTSAASSDSGKGSTPSSAGSGGTSNGSTGSSGGTNSASSPSKAAAAS